MSILLPRTARRSRVLTSPPTPASARWRSRPPEAEDHPGPPSETNRPQPADCAGWVAESAHLRESAGPAARLASAGRRAALSHSRRQAGPPRRCHRGRSSRRSCEQRVDGVGDGTVLERQRVGVAAQRGRGVVMAEAKPVQRYVGHSGGGTHSFAGSVRQERRAEPDAVAMSQEQPVAERLTVGSGRPRSRLVSQPVTGRWVGPPHRAHR